jgi:hypothetical protein
MALSLSSHSIPSSSLRFDTLSQTLRKICTILRWKTRQLGMPAAIQWASSRVSKPAPDSLAGRPLPCSRRCTASHADDFDLIIRAEVLPNRGFSYKGLCVHEAGARIAVFGRDSHHDSGIRAGAIRQIMRDRSGAY